MDDEIDIECSTAVDSDTSVDCSAAELGKIDVECSTPVDGSGDIDSDTIIG